MAEIAAPYLPLVGIRHDREALRGLWLMAALSIAVHATAFVMLLTAGSRDAGRHIQKRQAITAKIVRKGIKKPEKALPVIETAAPPVDSGAAVKSPAPAVVAPTPSNDSKAAKTATTQRPSDKLLSMLDQKLSKARQSERSRLGYGDPNGSPDGNSDVAAEGDLYLTAIQQKVKANWDVPTVIPAKERLYLNATVVIRLSTTGKVTDVQIETPSGNPLFDASLLKAVKKASPFGIPPMAFAAQYAAEGIGINFRPGT